LVSINERYGFSENIVENITSNSLATQGNGELFAEFLYNFLRGGPFQLVTFGGSVTAGHGTNIRWVDLLFHWMNCSQGNRKNNYINLSIPAAGAELPAYCAKTWMPSGTDWQLVILEFAINPSTEEDLSLLIRQLLSRPKTALLGLEIWSQKHQPMSSTYTPRGAFIGTLQAYGIPIISLRKALLHVYGAAPFRLEDIFAIDQHHLNSFGNELISSLFVTFFRSYCRIPFPRKSTATATLEINHGGCWTLFQKKKYIFFSPTF